MAEPTRVMHVVYRFAIGGLENVVAQLVNGLPHDQFVHHIVALTSISSFRDRIWAPGVAFTALGKGPGHAIPLYPSIFRLMRAWKPHVLHTCNLAALEVTPLGWLARVPRRVHVEHGWDAHDLNGSNPRYQWLRRGYRPFVNHYVAVSRDLDGYLAERVRVSSARHSLIPNGVDTDRFAPKRPRVRVDDCPFDPETHQIIGTVGRMENVKNQPLLAQAFVRMVAANPQRHARARLILVGDGPLRVDVEAILSSAGLLHHAWLPGARNDVAEILGMLSCFVLPSLTEGTSCTLQEAMATGLPCVATAVGGTPELLQGGACGVLVPSSDAEAMAKGIASVLDDSGKGEALGAMARQHALEHFALKGMLARYQALFRPPASAKEQSAWNR